MSLKEAFAKALPFLNLVALIVFAVLVLNVGTQCADCDRYCMDRLGIPYQGRPQNLSWWNLTNWTYNG
jgi:hypothetical protein